MEVKIVIKCFVRDNNPYYLLSVYDYKTLSLIYHKYFCCDLSSILSVYCEYYKNLYIGSLIKIENNCFIFYGVLG